MKKYVCSKRFLYALCFIALFAIDWVKGSQAGALMAFFLVFFTPKFLLEKEGAEDGSRPALD